MENWHLDKKVPIVFLIAIVVQTSAIIWWAANMDARVIQLETSENEDKAQDIITNDLSSQLSVLETRFNYFEQAQNEMKNDVRTLLDESRQP